MRKIITLLLVLFINGSATIRYCTTSAQCSTACMTSLVSGDTVDILGRIVLTTPISITNKKVLIQGHGHDSTIIVDSITSSAYGWSPFWITNNDMSDVRFTNMAFEKKSDLSNNGCIRIMGNSLNNRIDYIKITNKKGDGRGILIGANGLIDHDSICDGGLDNTFQGISVYGLNYNGNGNQDSVSWTRPDTLGVRTGTYMEDNVFLFKYDNDGAFDAYAGAKLVFRHNKTYNTPIGWHEWCTSWRGVKNFEIYNNTFIVDGTGQAHIFHSVFVRGGSGVIFNNIFTGNYDQAVAFDDYRTCQGGSLCSHTGPCNGSSWADGNMQFDSGKATGANGSSGLKCSGKSWSTNQWVNYYVWNLTDMSRGLITSNSSDSIIATLSTGARNNWNPSDSFKIVNGYPCRDQPGRSNSLPGTDYHLEQLQPVYQWNNLYNGVQLPAVVNDPTECSNPSKTDHIQKNRDYYDSIPLPGYTPFAYPHPLNTGSTRTLLVSHGQALQQLTISLHGASLVIMLPASIRSPELSAIDLSGREVYRAVLNVASRKADVEGIAVYDCAWRKAFAAGIYFAVVKESYLPRAAILARTRIVVFK